MFTLRPSVLLLSFRMNRSHLKQNGGVQGNIELQGDGAHSHFLSLFPAHLEAVERSVVFEGEDVVWDWKEVALGGDQTPDVHGLSCKTHHIRLHSHACHICHEESNLSELTRQRDKLQYKAGSNVPRVSTNSKNGWVFEHNCVVNIHESVFKKFSF